MKVERECFIDTGRSGHDVSQGRIDKQQRGHAGGHGDRVCEISHSSRPLREGAHRRDRPRRTGRRVPAQAPDIRRLDRAQRGQEVRGLLPNRSPPPEDAKYKRIERVIQQELKRQIGKIRGFPTPTPSRTLLPAPLSRSTRNRSLEKSKSYEKEDG